MSDKIPVEVASLSVDDRVVWVGKLPLQAMGGAATKRALDKFVLRYRRLIKECQTVVKRIEREKQKDERANPVRYWELGDCLLSFLKDVEKTPFFLNGFYEHLTRDLGLGAKLFQRCLRFRQVVTNRQDIDPNRTWTSYRTNAQQRRVC